MTPRSVRPASSPLLSELEAVAQGFGVSMDQAQRDHLISHLLAAIAASVASDVIFFGGTALSRTYLADARLSEDIDLIAITDRKIVAQKIENGVARQLARSHGQVTWQPALGLTKGSEPSIITAGGRLSVRIQLLHSKGYPDWPSQITSIEQRYSDVPSINLRVPTSDAFAAAKLSAWIDRRAARDLYDLWALSERSLITSAAFELFRKHGQFGASLPRWVLKTPPTEGEWELALAHQTRLTVSSGEALTRVRSAWASAAKPDVS
ncbi:nucleotidyl transferase AbiEii/AbiGii toxin family protein [Saxibacter everestensis]|uniref:Nucleotidyl transferase AbiEii/AbiGii toxin family protein n=1 Tax=Saxibacter everestensis TaxID=2909229 RepID=A0ABY8QXJ9_9MICO|nr:nucleotidyl transferase AbiEii/AbiGii toxin family protein [Brevibacteriaceae bacterium ZFBP1038]